LNIETEIITIGPRGFCPCFPQAGCRIIVTYQDQNGESRTTGKCLEGCWFAFIWSANERRNEISRIKRLRRDLEKSRRELERLRKEVELN